jgi:hypothetical protein
MAAGGNPDNISLGAGRLYVAPLATTEPTVASAALPSAWRAVGYTEDGTTITTELNNEEIEVAEEYDPVLYVMTKRKVMVSVQMAEATRRNLALALGTGANEDNDGTSFEPPDPGDELGFMMVWDSDDDATAGTNIRWLFRSCKISGSIVTQRNKAPNKALLPVEVNVQKPSGLAPFKVFPNADGLI